jgi:hypothetical protein
MAVVNNGYKTNSKESTAGEDLQWGKVKWKIGLLGSDEEKHKLVGLLGLLKTNCPMPNNATIQAAERHDKNQVVEILKKRPSTQMKSLPPRSSHTPPFPGDGSIEMTPLFASPKAKRMVHRNPREVVLLSHIIIITWRNKILPLFTSFSDSLERRILALASDIVYTHHLRDSARFTSPRTLHFSPSASYLLHQYQRHPPLRLRASSVPPSPCVVSS